MLRFSCHDRGLTATITRDHAGQWQGAITMTYLLRAFCVFVLLVISVPAHALDPALSLSQYGHTAWRMQDGIFDGQPQSISQTTDGYLWIATTKGLVRFDGVRFTPWVPPDGSSLPSNHTTALLPDADGGLWIGASGDLAHWSNGKLETFPDTRGRVLDIRPDSAGNVWMLRSRQGADAGPLCRISGHESHCFDPGKGHPCKYASALAIDADDTLWLGGTGGLCRFRDGRFSTFLADELGTNSALAGIVALAMDPQRALWIGAFRQTGSLTGLGRFRDGTYTRPEVEEFDTHHPVVALMYDGHGALWVGTNDDGIYRIWNGKAQHFGSADGLSSDGVISFFEDREGDVWVATSAGIDRFRNMHVATYSMREGLVADSVSSVLTVRDGSVLIGNSGALNVIRDGIVSRFDPAPGVNGRATSFLEDHKGRTWVGFDQDMMIHNQHGFSRVTTYDGKPAGLMIALSEDSAGDVWGIQPWKQLVRFSGDKLVERIPIEGVAADLVSDGSGGFWLAMIDGIARYRSGAFEKFAPSRDVGRVTQVRTNADGSLWAVTDKGLLYVKHGQTRMLDMQHGLPCQSVYAFVKDDRGSMWLSMPCGYVRIAAPELDRWLHDKDASVQTRLFDAVDGARPGWADFSPRVSKGADGRLWFATGSVLQMIDPAHLDENRIVPPVHVEALIVDRKHYPATGPVRLPPRSQDIQIDYTALSFVAPQHMKFRYRLEGHDTDWQDVGTRREAFYSGLAPGNYRFRVIASNNDGLWNEEGATLDFNIAPAWYQTLGFRALCILVFIGILWGLHGLRLRAVARSMGVRFDERLAERTRIARELHDTLLQGVQGLLLNIHVAAKKPEAESKPMLERALLTADRIIIEGRNRVSSLRVEHLTDDELLASIETVAHELSPTAGVGFLVTRSGSTSQLQAPVADEVFYIVREALTNAFRHARATQIEVKLHYGLRHFVMSCEDDGCGFDASLPEKPGHWGLGGMAERASRIGGVFECRSTPGEGTSIRVRIPSYRAYSQSSRLLFHLRGLTK